MVNMRIRKNLPANYRKFWDRENMSDLEHELLSPLALLLKNPMEALNDRAWAPRVDIIEKEESWVFKVELPDIATDDIKITIEEGVLTIKGERKFEEETREGNYTRLERQYGLFERRFSLPSGIDPDKVAADYKNGILTLMIPKKEELKPKSIQIDIK